MLLFALFSSFPQLFVSTPVLTPVPAIPNIIQNSKQCFLPKSLGYNGEAKFIEDCESMERFEFLPKPESNDPHKFGTHALVCCPKQLTQYSILFTTDPEHPEYEESYQDESYPGELGDFDTHNEYVVSQDSDGLPPDKTNGFGGVGEVNPGSPLNFQIPKVSEDFCPGVELPGVGVISECVSLDQCQGVLDNDYAPSNQTLACGFDEDKKVMKICCPQQLVRTDGPVVLRKTRFTSRSGQPYKVQDRSSLCSRWRRNGACNLDTDFVMDESVTVFSWEMIEFMQKVCMKTCGMATGDVCYDEHGRCEDWARLGMCLENPRFMSHTCRESCGVCGFLSPDNTDEQTVNDMSYSDHRDIDFDCGRRTLLSDVTTPSPPIDIGIDTKVAQLVDPRKVVKTKREADEEELADEDLVFSFTTQDKDSFFCGTTIINDRWLVAAAHCFSEFSSAEDISSIRTTTIRDKTPYRETIEIKRVYIHPSFEYPGLSHDIALLELGRRIEYDFDKFGDTPSCLDQGEDNVGEVATLLGYGNTENGRNGFNLLEANVTLISNEECRSRLQYNISSDPNKDTIERLLCKDLPNGINDQFLCATGIYNEEKGIFSGSCKGDSGGPLYVDDSSGKRTFAGIVSGGLYGGQSSCGRHARFTGTGWYTKVSYYTDWITCVLDMSLLHTNNKNKVEEACARFKIQDQCVKESEIIFSCPNQNICDPDDLDLRDEVKINTK